MAVITTHCTESHRGQIDPIRNPGGPLGGMRHVFFGNVTTNNDSTLESLRLGATTCKDSPNDHSAYWVPEIYVDGKPIKQKIGAYWRNNGVRVAPIPQGMQFVANMDGSGWGTIAGFGCTHGGDISAVPLKCHTGDQAKFRVLFPDCWDGQGLAQENFAYATGKTQPAGFPIRIVQLLLQVDMPIVDATAVKITCATTGPDGVSSVHGPYQTMHADFIMAFNEAAFVTEIVDKLNATV